MRIIVCFPFAVTTKTKTETEMLNWNHIEVYIAVLLPSMRNLYIYNLYDVGRTTQHQLAAIVLICRVYKLPFLPAVSRATDVTASPGGYMIQYR